MPEPLHPQVPRAPHGGPGARPFAGLDFSVNSNPFGPNPQLVSAARHADPGAYPDATLTALRRTLADLHAARPDAVVPAVGASELLHRVARAYLRPGARALTLGPAFGEFARAVALQGAHLDRLDPARPRDWAATLAVRPTLVYVSRPNNPLGTSVDLEDLHALADACAHADALLILDEAYRPLVPDLPTLPMHAAVLTLHSPGKLHGVVGLRPAYALAPPQVANALENLAPTWPLPSPVVATLAALPDAQAFVADTLPRWQAAARDLARDLAALAPVAHHGPPFLTVRVGDAARVSAALLERGLRVRDCASYGHPDLIRVCARQPHDNARLVRALAEVQGG